MQAYLNNPEVKDLLVNQMKDHVAADELVTGDGWNGSKGCSVGCLFHAYDHSLGAEIMGTPEWLHRLQDTIHENCSEDFRKTFSIDFLNAIPVGADVESVKSKIHIFIQERNKTRVEALDIGKDIKKQIIGAIDMVIILYNGEFTESAAGSAAWSAAESAGSAARSAARSAAGSAAWSAAESAGSAARSAARSAAGSATWSAAWSAAESARFAARFAAWSAAESAAGSAAESAAESAEIDIVATKLIALLKAA